MKQIIKLVVYNIPENAQRVSAWFFYIHTCIERLELLYSGMLQVTELVEVKKGRLFQPPPEKFLVTIIE